MKKIVCIALFLLPAIAAAQQPPVSRFEITPFVGYMRGGSIHIDDSQLTNGPVEVKFEQSAAWGVRVDQTLGWGPDMRIEYLFERAQSQLEDNRRLFGETPSGGVPPGSFSYTDVSATYLQVGIIRSIGRKMTQVYDLRPYVVGGVGVNQVSMHSIPLDEQLRPAVSLGGGFHWTLSDKMGLRFETRGFYTNLEDSSTTVPLTNRDCQEIVGNPCIRTYSFPNHFFQIDLTAGLSWKF